jgi:diadenosine tetraphosphate (Ap4A) HIT family hydrolase
MSEISEAVASARAGTNDTVIYRMDSGWAVIGNVQLLPGHTVPELHAHIIPGTRPNPTSSGAGPPGTTGGMPRSIRPRSMVRCVSASAEFSGPEPEPRGKTDRQAHP